MKMKHLIIQLLVATLVITTASAEALYPSEVVENLVKAIKSNDLKQTITLIDFPAVAAFPRHGRKPEDVIEFLSKIDLKESEIQHAYNYQDFSWPKVAVVRLRGKINMDFELRLIAATPENQEDHYILVGMHP
jgi:hypothetical protein